MFQRERKNCTRWFVTLSIVSILTTGAATANRVDVFGSDDRSVLDRINQSRASVALDATVSMTCFPPSAGMGPPCIVPTGLDPDLVAPNPSGELRFLAFENDTSLAWIELDGLAPDLVVTAWLVFTPPGSPPPAPIFAPIGPGLPPVAAASTPLASTGARFSEGAGWEPNRFRIRPKGGGRLIAWLDYNPLKPDQAPLRNGTMSMNQGLAPAGTAAAQPPCCADSPVPPAPGPRLSPIGSSFLRRFDPETGFQVLGADGRPEILRSPTAVPLIVVIVHIDRMTHGIQPGIVIPPFPGSSFPVTAGDHYVLGIFPLGGLSPN